MIIDRQDSLLLNKDRQIENGKKVQKSLYSIIDEKDVIIKSKDKEIKYNKGKSREEKLWIAIGGFVVGTAVGIAIIH
jgi:hypothetical protein